LVGGETERVLTIIKHKNIKIGNEQSEGKLLILSPTFFPNVKKTEKKKKNQYSPTKLSTEEFLHVYLRINQFFLFL